MNIFYQEMRMDRKSLITWILSLIGTTWLFMLMYPPIAAQMDLFLQMIENFPIEAQRAFGVANFGYSGIIGYYSSILTYILLAGAIQAMNLGVSTLSAEVRAKTADFLYAKPVSRQRIITAKIMAVLAQIVIVNICFVASAWFIVNAMNGDANQTAVNFEIYMLMTGTLAFIQILFVCLGLFVSSFLKRIRTVLPISMGVVFFFYTIYILNQSLENAELAYLSPFGYFDLTKILANGAYESKYLIAMCLLIVIFISLTYRSYMKKDLPSI
jgi:ABC-2 type transport system permease protein